MKKIFSIFSLLLATVLLVSSANAQYNGKVTYKKADYVFKTTCTDEFGSDEAKMKVEYYGITVAKTKRGKKKTVLVTPCKTFILRSYPESMKDGMYKITFTTMDKSSKLMAGVTGTKKKVRYDFDFQQGSVKTKDGKWSENAKDLNDAIGQVVAYLAKNMKL